MNSRALHFDVIRSRIYFFIIFANVSRFRYVIFFFSIAFCLSFVVGVVVVLFSVYSGFDFGM